MTLNELINFLEPIPEDVPVKYGFGEAGSYRVRLNEIAFEPVLYTTVGKMLGHAKKAKGSTYTGYKGGDFKITSNTTVNVASDENCHPNNDEITTYMLSFMVDLRSLVGIKNTPWKGLI